MTTTEHIEDPTTGTAPITDPNAPANPETPESPETPNEPGHAHTDCSGNCPQHP
jgi:hypothetical protein